MHAYILWFVMIFLGKPVKSKIPVLSTKTRSKEPPGAEDDEGSVLKRYTTILK
jgi:hypothetical protein